jgi:hypothetical protein
MRASFLAAAVLAALVVLAASAQGSPRAFVSFKTPSGNIGCIADSSSGGYLRCDIRSGLRPRPRSSSCNGEYGDSLSMTRNGRVGFTCHGDTTLDPRARVLAYGRTWRGNGFACTSRTTGLTCQNAAGHGFFLSRESYRRF